MEEHRHRTDQDSTSKGEQQEKGERPIGWREKVAGDGQTTDAGNDEGEGRTQGVDKVDSKAKFWDECGWFNG